MLRLLCLLGGSHALRLAHLPRASVRMAIDASVLREVASYDSEKEAELRDLQARLASADWNAHQNRELVGKAQEDLAKQDQMRKALKAEVAGANEAAAISLTPLLWARSPIIV